MKKIAALTTEADELTMIEAGLHLAKILWFIELYSRPQSNPNSESNSISQLSGTDSSPLQWLSWNTQPAAIVSTQPPNTDATHQIMSPFFSTIYWV